MNNQDKEIVEEIVGFDALWDSMLKCQRGVRWKPSVKDFIINSPDRILKMHDALKNGSWENSSPKPIKISYPKKRDGLSIPFADRVYQGSLHDNVVYPEITKHYVFDNCACQKKKGPSFARRRIKEHLWNFYSNHGNNGYVLQIDIKEYFKHIRQNLVEDNFDIYLSIRVAKMVYDILDKQHSENSEGYFPGSPMVQISAISILNNLDHYIKERLRIKHFIRYNDDFWLLHESRECLEECLRCVGLVLGEYGFSLHNKKTGIKPLSKGFTFLGFNYRITDTGKVVMTLNSDNVRHERKKLRRMINKCKRGEMTVEKVNESYNGWKNFANEGNSHKLIVKMDEYYWGLWKS